MTVHYSLARHYVEMSDSSGNVRSFKVCVDAMGTLDMLARLHEATCEHSYVDDDNPS